MIRVLRITALRLQLLTVLSRWCCDEFY